METKPKGILIPVQIENVTTRRDHTIKITLGTQELEPEKAGLIFGLQNKLAAAYFSEKGISQEDIDIVDSIDPDLPGKSQSQRLRGVLFKLFQQNKEGFVNFDSYYHHHTDRIIEHFKSKIED